MRVFLVFIVIISLGGCSRLADDAVIQVLDRAWVLEGEQLSSPQDVQALIADKAEDIRLPDAWIHENQIADQWHRYYQLNLPATSADLQRPAIFIPRVAHNLRVYLNQQLIWQPDNMGSTLSRNWNRPQLIPIPVSALDASDNRLFINVQSNFSGFLSPLFIGEYDQLYHKQRMRLFWQQSLNQSLFAVVLAVGLFTGLLWYFRRSQRLYLYCSLASLCWAFYMYSLVVVDPGIPKRLFWTLLHGSVDAWVFFITLFCLRFRGVILARFERIYAWILILTLVFYAFLPPLALIIFSSVVHLISLMICLWCALGQVRVEVERDAIQHRILGGSLLIFVALSLYDSWLHSPWGALYSSELFDLSATSAPIVMLLIAWNLAVRFTRSMKEAEYLQHNLEREIAKQKDKLESEFELETRNRIKAREFKERRDIYRVLHDELSEKLLALLHTAQTNQQAETARAAIAELRDATLSANTPAEKLDVVLADCRSEAQQRCAEFGLPLDWETLGDIETYSLDSSVNSCVRRTIRESLNNLFKYSRATQVQINIRIEEQSDQQQLLIGIVDNGVGMDEQKSFEPVSLKARIDAVGGKLQTFSKESEGTQIQIRLPVISETAGQIAKAEVGSDLRSEELHSKKLNTEELHSQESQSE